MSQFLKEAVEKELRVLRAHCATVKYGLDHATDPKSYWGTDTGSSTYWADMKAKAAVDRAVELEEAYAKLASFIAEHRDLMGPDWIGNDHGRLCWASYLGGMLIAFHHCQCDEGHEGNHANDIGAWPQGVRSDQQWHALKEAEERKGAA